MGYLEGYVKGKIDGINYTRKVYDVLLEYHNITDTLVVEDLYEPIYITGMDCNNSIVECENGTMQWGWYN